MPNYFLHTLQQLRAHETVILYEKWLDISDADQVEATAFLAQSYRDEAADYPHLAPAFDPVAGLWGAKTVYLACQLMLHRTDEPTDLAQRLPGIELATASAMLSADLTLRFLPDVLTQLRLTDPDDALIPVLETHLQTGHYSGVCAPLNVERLDLGPVIADACLRQLYIDRVMAYKNKPLATHPALIDGVRAGLGMFTADFWPDLEATLS